MTPQVSVDVNFPYIVRCHATTVFFSAQPTSSIPSYEITLFDAKSVFARIANWHPIQFENHSKHRMDVAPPMMPPATTGSTNAQTQTADDGIIIVVFFFFLVVDLGHLSPRLLLCLFFRIIRGGGGAF